jgi:AcrR family transcriptional regulator
VNVSEPDRRVRRTRAAVQRALLELMIEKGYEAVTATDLIERADIGRSTFYAHFTDKRQVLDDNLDDLGAFLRSHRHEAGAPLFSFSLPLFEHVHDQRRLLQVLLGPRGGTVVQERLAQLLAELVREELTALTPDAEPAVPVDLAVAVVVGAILGLLRSWAGGESRWTPTELDRALRCLLVPGTTAALTRRSTTSAPTAPVRL